MRCQLAYGVLQKRALQNKWNTGFVVNTDDAKQAGAEQ